jgi:hypothetical protein
MADKHTLICGIPANIGGVLVRQPTLHEIFRVVGHDRYSGFLYVIGISIDQFMESMEKGGARSVADAYKALTDEQRSQIHRFDLLLAEPSWRGILMDALSFFICGDLDFDLQHSALYVVSDNGRVMMDGDLFDSVRDFVFQAARLKHEESKPTGFVNAAAKAAYEKLQALKAEQATTAKKKESKGDPDMELWNLIGAVAAHSRGYNLLNIFELTVYQLYDQFERINNQEYLDGYASKWAAWGKDSFDFGGWYKTSSNK